MEDDVGFSFSPMDLDTPTAAAPPRAPRFRPKSRKVPKSDPTPPAVTKPDPGPDPPAVAKPDPEPPAVAKPDPDPPSLPAPPPLPIQMEEEKEKEQAAAEDSSMVVADAVGDFEDDFEDDFDDDKDEFEDVVVRELDVFFAPSIADGASLYVMQYPLRPPWRPYDLSESCEEVRLKPKHSKVEVDFSMDIINGNYDDEMAESSRSQKQMLSSAVTPSTSGFAIGTIMGNQLHLNPVHAVVQLRPSLKHTRAGVARRKQNSRSLESNKKPNEKSLGGSLKPSTEQGKPEPDNSNEGLDDVEPWVPLKYHPIESSLSRSYQKQMMREKNNHVKFVVKNSDYVTSLCPGTSTDNKRSIGIAIRDLISLSLEERLIKWLSEGRQVNQFAALLHLDPTISIKDDLLRILPLYAYLVQGLWVSKSSLICKGFEALVRDYIIFLFSKNKTIRYDKRKSSMPLVVKRYLSQFAFQRPLFSDLKFREATDLSFIKAYPDAVKEQECAWSSREQELLESLRGPFKNMLEKQAVDFLMNALNPKLVKKVTSSGMADPGHKKDINMMASSTGMMPSSSQEDLVKVLLEVFRLHSVRSLGSIKQVLQGRGIDPPPELISVLGQITENVHGVYVSKSAGNPDLHALRTVIIKLFMENKPNAKLTNKQIVAAVRSSLNRNFSADEYKQVVNGLCINKDGWMLKDGEC